MKILIVDDLPDNFTMLRDLLSVAGYDVTTASSGEQALDILSKEVFQLLIVDWMMPRMDGLEFIQHVRDEFREPYRYIIMLTARNERDDMITGLESGVDDYMARPFSSRELQARVKIGERIINLQNRLRANLLQIERAKLEWEATTDAIPQLICLVDNDGSIVRANGAVSAWKLAPSNNVRGVQLPDLMRRGYPDFANQLQTAWDEAKLNLSMGSDFDYEGMDKTRGHHFHVQFEPVQAVGDMEMDEHTFAAVNIHDITRYKELQIELQLANRQIELKHQESERLLLNILPASIAQRLKRGEVTIADSFENVTVLFSDLVGFTPLTASTPPSQLMTMLNEIFSIFDDLTERYELEKIKTMGDAYMVAGGLPIPQPDHAHRVANMALGMLKAVDAFNAKSDHSLSIRIGIASGPVVAGVIGRKKFTYDLWGNTVNTASRMETHGVSGCIQVTQATYNLLKDDFHFEERGALDIKGQGPLSAYILKGSVS